GPPGAGLDPDATTRDTHPLRRTPPLRRLLAGRTGPAQCPLDRGAAGLPSADRGGSGRRAPSARAKHPRRRPTTTGGVGREARLGGIHGGEGARPNEGHLGTAPSTDTGRAGEPSRPGEGHLSTAACGPGAGGGSLRAVSEEPAA